MLMRRSTPAMVSEAFAEISRRLLRPAARLVRVCSSSSLLSMRFTMLVTCVATTLSSSIRSVAERAVRTRSKDSSQATVAPSLSGGNSFAPGMTPMYLSPRKPAVSMKNLASARIWYSALILASSVTMPVSVLRRIALILPTGTPAMRTTEFRLRPSTFFVVRCNRVVSVKGLVPLEKLTTSAATSASEMARNRPTFHSVVVFISRTPNPWDRRFR